MTDVVYTMPISSNLAIDLLTLLQYYTDYLIATLGSRGAKCYSAGRSSAHANRQLALYS